MIPSFAPVNAAARAAHHHDGIYAGSRGQPGYGLVHVVFQGDGLGAANALVRGDDHRGFTVLNPTAQGLWRESAKDHRVHRANASAGQHGHRGLRDHGHVEGDPVAFSHAQVPQGVAKAAHLFVQLAIGDAGVICRIIAFPDNGGLIAPGGQMPVQAVHGHVQLAVGEPANVQIFLGVADILDLSERLHPVQTLGLLGPEGFRIVKGRLIKALILCVCDMGAPGHSLGNRIDLLFTHGEPRLVPNGCRGSGRLLCFAGMIRERDGGAKPPG